MAIAVVAAGAAFCAPASGALPPISAGPSPAGPQAGCTIEGGSQDLLECTRTFLAADASTPLLADVWMRRAVPRQNLPMVILVHGGGFEGGWRRMMNSEAVYLAQRGYLAISIDHRLGPCLSGGCFECSTLATPDHPCGHLIGTAHSLDDMARDVGKGVLAARDWGHLYGGADPNRGASRGDERIGVLGVSSGGYLAAMANYRGAPGQDRPDGAVSWGGPLVLDPAVWDLYGQRADLQSSVAAVVLAGLIGCSPLACPLQWQALSPTFYVDAGDPPMRIVDGIDDPLVRQEHAWMMYRQLTEAQAGVSAIPHGPIAGIERWIWSSTDSCTDGSPPAGGSCGPIINCGATHSFFQSCIHRSGTEAVDPGDSGHYFPLRLEAGYRGISELQISACFLRRQIEGLSGAAYSACLVQPPPSRPGGAGGNPGSGPNGGGSRCGLRRVGTGGPDRLVGTGSRDLLLGFGGRDTLLGRRGADCLRGGSGADRLVGGGGGDQLSGGPGSDRLLARDGRRDVIRCGAGRDSARVDGDDSVRGCESVSRAAR